MKKEIHINIGTAVRKIIRVEADVIMCGQHGGGVEVVSINAGTIFSSLILPVSTISDILDCGNNEYFVCGWKGM